MDSTDSVMALAEEIAGSDGVTHLAAAIWRDPEIGRRLAEQPEATLREFDITLPESLELVPLGFGRRLRKPAPDFVPFEIRMSRCRTVVVLDKATGIPKTETVCLGIEIIPKPWPGGPIGSRTVPG